MKTRAAQQKPVAKVVAIATVDVVAKADVGTLQQQAAPLAQRIQALVVTDAASFTEAGTLLKTLAAYVKRVGEIFDPVVQSAHEAHQVALKQRAALLQPAELAKRTLSQRMEAYDREQERLRQEALKRQREEQERLQREENARVEAERRRLEAEAQEQAATAAAAARAAGDPELANRILGTPVLVEMPAPRPVFAPPVAVASAPKVEGVGFRDNWRAEVTDLMALVKAVAAGSQPITYLEPNEVALNQVARALKDKMAVPGVRAKNDRTTATKV